MWVGHYIYQLPYLHLPIPAAETESYLQLKQAIPAESIKTQANVNEEIKRKKISFHFFILHSILLLSLSLSHAIIIQFFYLSLNSFPHIYLIFLSLPLNILYISIFFSLYLNHSIFSLFTQDKDVKNQNS